MGELSCEELNTKLRSLDLILWFFAQPFFLGVSTEVEKKEFWLPISTRQNLENLLKIDKGYDTTPERIRLL